MRDEYDFSKGKRGAVIASGAIPGIDARLVSRDPEIMSGALCFTGTRVAVKSLFDYLEGSSSLEQFLDDFPSVHREHAVAVLEVAKERLFASQAANPAAP